MWNDCLNEWSEAHAMSETCKGFNDRNEHFKEICRNSTIGQNRMYNGKTTDLDRTYFQYGTQYISKDCEK